VFFCTKIKTAGLEPGQSGILTWLFEMPITTMPGLSMDSSPNRERKATGGEILSGGKV